MRKFLSTAVLAVLFAGVAASAASATVGPAMLTDRNPTGTGSNIAATAGFDGAVNLAASTFQVNTGGATVTCPTVDYKITKLTTNTAHFDASFGNGNCTTSISGIQVGVTVDVGCQWTLTFHNAIFDTTTASTTNITADLPCVTRITVPAASCSIDVPAGNYGHIDAQNINTLGQHDTSANPTGVRLTPTINNLPFTSNCPTIPASGTATYRGPVYIHNVWGML